MTCAAVARGRVCLIGVLYSVVSVAVEVLHGFNNNRGWLSIGRSWQSLTHAQHLSTIVCGLLLESHQQGTFAEIVFARRECFPSYLSSSELFNTQCGLLFLGREVAVLAWVQVLEQLWLASLHVRLFA